MEGKDNLFSRIVKGSIAATSALGGYYKTGWLTFIHAGRNSPALGL